MKNQTQAYCNLLCCVMLGQISRQKLDATSELNHIWDRDSPPWAKFSAVLIPALAVDALAICHLITVNHVVQYY